MADRLNYWSAIVQEGGQLMQVELDALDPDVLQPGPAAPTG